LLHTAVDPGGTMIVVFRGGGAGILLLTHPAKATSPFYSPDRGAGGVLSLGRGSPLRLFIAISERIWVGAGG
jgi:hypothetical protein